MLRELAKEQKNLCDEQTNGNADECICARRSQDESEGAENTVTEAGKSQQKTNKRQKCQDVEGYGHRCRDSARTMGITAGENR